MNDADPVKTPPAPAETPVLRELRSEIRCIEALIDALTPAVEPLAVLNVYRLDEALRSRCRTLRALEHKAAAGCRARREDSA